MLQYLNCFALYLVTFTCTVLCSWKIRRNVFIILRNNLSEKVAKLAVSHGSMHEWHDRLLLWLNGSTLYFAAHPSCQPAGGRIDGWTHELTRSINVHEVYRYWNKKRCVGWLGAETNQCDARGVCQCKPGVMGDKCDQCLPNHFELGPEGCRFIIYAST